MVQTGGTGVKDCWHRLYVNSILWDLSFCLCFTLCVLQHNTIMHTRVCCFGLKTSTKNTNEKCKCWENFIYWRIYFKL